MYPLRIRSVRSITRKLLIELVIALVILLAVPALALAALSWAGGTVELGGSWLKVELPESVK